MMLSAPSSAAILFHSRLHHSSDASSLALCGPIVLKSVSKVPHQKGKHVYDMFLPIRVNQINRNLCV